MKSPPRLRIELRASRIATAVVGCAIVATAIVAFATISDAATAAFVVLVVGVVGVRGVRSLLRPPLLLHVGADRRVSVTLSDGRTVDGTVHPDTSVGAWITTLVWVPDGARWFVAAKTLVVLPDMLSKDDFRRLRVYLRHGRSTPDRDTSGASAR